ncbi:DnaA regulatory inactivator Hda [Lysobacter pythonis]|uniref:DnaA regulatory inactivator Hda n=1 Tax=Solilutibacter pythonis TaxID=2483112 RepID=A0A3M2I4E7_9GAMM|nr:DnaA regulatory inactivator Hda [Lysobacter pythonis]RMH94102.1 DnaA regulatory inactivator Hda [Lysobacter pythonis]
MSNTPQLPLALRYPPDQRLESFVAAPPAALAQLHALAAGAGDWLYLCGPSGVGKTHLALAVCAEAEARGVEAQYLPLVALAGRLAAALPAPRAGALYALDGLDAAAGGRADEVALFDFHNAARDGGAYLLYTARAVPDALGLDLPDLRSRLGQCARIALAPPDDAVRAAILRLRAERRGLQFDEAAIDWLLKRVERDMSSLTALFERLDRESLAAQRRLTVPFLRQVLEAGG